MTKKWGFIAVATMVLALVAFTGVASAAQVTGEGTIRAKGRGVAIVRGDGVVDIRGHGAGIVFVAGAETLDVRGQGIRLDYEQGVLLIGWSGAIHVEGRGLLVEMQGGIIEFSATGVGTVNLRGHGRYVISGHEGLWSPEGAQLEIGQTLAEPVA